MKLNFDLLLSIGGDSLIKDRVFLFWLGIFISSRSNCSYLKNCEDLQIYIYFF